MTDDQSDDRQVRTPGPGRPNGLLDILMHETLDPGYAAAAARRTGEPPSSDRRRNDQVLTAAGALLVGLLLVIAYVHANRSAPADARVRSDLRHRVVTAERDNATLATSADTLQAQIDALGSSALRPGDGQRLRAAQLAAGAVAVQGPGVRVVIGNPPISPSATPTRRRGTTGLSSVSLLTDLDVRSVVNQLWTAGAEAIAVDDIRLTPTSAIRFAGQAVLVDFQPVTAPYTITAIGPAAQLNTTFTSSAIADRFRTLSSAYGFVFTFSQESNVHVPASSSGNPRYAHPVQTGPSTRLTPTTSTPPSTPTPSSPSRSTPSAGPTS